MPKLVVFFQLFLVVSVILSSRFPIVKADGYGKVLGTATNLRGTVNGTKTSKEEVQQGHVTRKLPEGGGSSHYEEDIQHKNTDTATHFETRDATGPLDPGSEGTHYDDEEYEDLDLSMYNFTDEELEYMEYNDTSQGGALEELGGGSTLALSERCMECNRAGCHSTTNYSFALPPLGDTCKRLKCDTAPCSPPQCWRCRSRGCYRGGIANVLSGNKAKAEFCQTRGCFSMTCITNQCTKCKKIGCFTVKRKSEKLRKKCWFWGCPKLTCARGKVALASKVQLP